MSTIVNKLEYLNETKETIKTALKNKNIEVNDDDTFRSYEKKKKKKIDEFFPILTPSDSQY